MAVPRPKKSSSVDVPPNPPPPFCLRLTLKKEDGVEGDHMPPSLAQCEVYWDLQRGRENDWRSKSSPVNASKLYESIMRSQMDRLLFRSII